MEQNISGIHSSIKGGANTVADLMGKLESGFFTWHSNEVFNQYNIESPIEQIVYMSLLYIGKLNRYDVSVQPLYKEKFIKVFPQHQVGKYRVDFALHYSENDNNKWVAVECDGHEFHDRDEQQRRYEKQRDRYLQRKGFMVMHFTGSEIVNASFKAATEIIQAVLGNEVTLRKLKE